MKTFHLLRRRYSFCRDQTESMNLRLEPMPSGNSRVLLARCIAETRGELEKLPGKVILNSMSRARDMLIISLLLSVKIYYLSLFILTHFPWH